MQLLFRQALTCVRISILLSSSGLWSVAWCLRGFSWLCPAGYEAQVRPRSGLALKKGITVLNSPGTIDADYRGEVCIILVNLSTEPFTIEDGERVAQMVIARHEQAEWEVTDVLDETERGEGGFGHSGRK